MTNRKWQRMLDARKAVQRARVEFESAAKDLFRKGTRVRWEHGRHLQEGAVIDVSFGADRLKVRARSGKEYWVATYRVLMLREVTA